MQSERGPNLPLVADINRFGAARHSGLSLQVQNRGDAELVVCPGHRSRQGERF